MLEPNVKPENRHDGVGNTAVEEQTMAAAVGSTDQPVDDDDAGIAVDLLDDNRHDGNP